MKKLVANAWPMLASVVMLALAFPPTNISLLVFVALVPWIVQLRQCDRRGAIRSGYWFGALYFWFQMFWIVLFVHRWTGNLVLSLIPWVVCGVIAGLFYALVAWLIKVCMDRGWGLAIPFVWAGIEGFRAYVPGLAFPWGNISLPLWPYPWMVQHAAWGTMFLVSAWVMAGNLILVAIFFPGEQKAHPRAMLWSMVGFFGLLAMSMGRFVNRVPVTDRIFSLGQPGVDMAFSPPEEEQIQLAEASRQILARAGKPDLLVLPEGFAGRNQGDPAFTPLGRTPDFPVIMGGHRVAPDATYQTAFLWDGKRWQHGDKTRLVVFGEYVPFRDQIPFLRSFNLPTGDLEAGPILATLQAPGMKIGPLICFEGVFPDLAEGHCRNGAQVLVQMSIDDWYESTPAHDQLWMSSVWRSIESGLPLVRVGARGRTLATDQRGDVVAIFPLGEVGGWPVKLGVPARSDAFAYRMAFVYVCWIICAGVGIFALSERWRREGDSNP